MMRMIKRALLLAALVGSTPAFAASYDPFGEFDGTTASANFRFGYTGAAFTGALTPFDIAQTSACNGYAELVCAGTTAADSIGVYKAVVNGGDFAFPGTPFFQAGELNLHPSNGDLRAGVQFVAPTAGTYSFVGDFSRNDDQATNRQVLAYVGTSGVLSQVFVNGPISFDFTATLAAGETVTFAVGTGGDGYSYDSTGLKLTVANAAAAGVPEPTTWAMMIGGIGAAGGALRRRKARRFRFA